MWSDDIDKKIQDAAGNHEPPFFEEDWNRMNVLLDKHLPQEKKKGPFLFRLLSLLLIGLPAWVMLTTYRERPSEQVTQRTETFPAPFSRTQKDFPSISQEQAGTAVTEKRSATTEQAIIPATPPAIPDRSVQKYNERVTTINTNQVQKRRKKISEHVVRQKSADPAFPVINSADPEIPPGQSSTTGTTPAAGKTMPPASVTEGSSASSTEATGSKTSKADSSSSTNDETKNDSLPEEKPVTKNKKPGDRKGGKWQISFSTGPDLSLIGVGKTGKWKMQYGLGVSYAINDRISVRTGFMVSRKLYYADSADYHPPKGFWNYYTNLQKIDANCLVYEIPLNVIYSFPSAKKHQWFVSGGLSSYLMKEETYEYYFKDAGGGDQYRQRTVRNENDHFFSILQLSGGYQYTLSGKFSLMAEPYMKLPLGGVGFGKVKLNNTGVLFTLGFKPFVKK